MRFVSYEEGSAGVFSEREMYRLWQTRADKSEYPDFPCWKQDMLRSGVFEKL